MNKLRFVRLCASIAILYGSVQIAHGQVGTQHDRIRSRGSSTFDQFSNTSTLTITGATPSVANGNVFLTNNGSATAITNFVGGVDSQQITVICGDTNTTIQNNANIVITGGANFTCVLNNAISFVFNAASSAWGQIGGSGAGGGSSPGAPAQSPQCNNGSGGFVACNALDDNTNFAINDNVQFLGPNPYIDVARYGQYANASPPSTTASCTNASTSVTLAAALDFKDATSFPKTNLGNGIVIYQCGAATDLITPVAPTVTPSGQLGMASSGIINGATTYNYKYVAQSEKLGLTAAGAAGTTTTGAATLGLNTINLTSVTWNSTLNGEQVYTCSGNCNVGDNTPIRIDGFTNGRFNGNYTVIAHTGTTFTVYSPSVPAPTVTTESVAATVKLLACNRLTMPSNASNTVEAGSDTILRWIIYRNNVLVGYAQSRDPYYEDCGMNVADGNFELFVPRSPGAAVNNSLITTIVSGAGTTSIVVANAAGATTSGQTAQHDNSKNLLTAAAVASLSTPVYFNGTNAPFNAPTIFSTTGNTKVLLPTGATVKEPWIVRGDGWIFEGGQNNASASFQFENAAFVNGGSFTYPIVGVEMGHGQRSGHGISFKHLLFNGQILGMEAFETDFDVSSLFGLQMQDVGFFNSLSSSNVNTPAAHFRGLSEGAIGKPGDRNACSTAQIAPGPPCMRFSDVSIALNTNGISSVARDIQINGFAVQGGGSSYQFDTLPAGNSGGSTAFGANDIRFVDGLGEIRKGPFLRVVGASSAWVFYFKYIDDDQYNATAGNGFVDAAAAGGGSNTGLQLTFEQITAGGGAGPDDVAVSGPSFQQDVKVIIGTGTPFSLTQVTGATGFPGTTGTAFSNGPNFNGTGNLQAIGTANFGYQFGIPTAPNIVVGASGSCSVSCVPAGTWFYSWAAVDFAGNDSLRSPYTTAVVDGTQTVTFTVTPIPGQILFNPSRSANTTTANFAFGTGPNGSGLPGISFLDGTGNYIFSAFNLGVGNQSSISSSGIASPSMIVTGGGFKSTVTGTFTANRTPVLEDGAGFIPVTTEAFFSSPRGPLNAIFSGALTTTWTGETFTLDKAITVTRVQVQLRTAPSSCSTNAVVRLTDGTTPINVSLTAAANDSGAITQNYAAGAVLTSSVQTAAASCAVSPGDANVVVQYRMQ